MYISKRENYFWHWIAYRTSTKAFQIFSSVYVGVIDWCFLVSVYIMKRNGQIAADSPGVLSRRQPGGSTLPIQRFFYKAQQYNWCVANLIIQYQNPTLKWSNLWERCTDHQRARRRTNDELYCCKVGTCKMSSWKALKQWTFVSMLLSLDRLVIHNYTPMRVCFLKKCGVRASFASYTCSLGNDRYCSQYFINHCQVTGYS